MPENGYGQSELDGFCNQVQWLRVFPVADPPTIKWLKVVIVSGGSSALRMEESAYVSIISFVCIFIDIPSWHMLTPPHDHWTRSRVSGVIFSLGGWRLCTHELWVTEEQGVAGSVTTLLPWCINSGVPLWQDCGGSADQELPPVEQNPRCRVDKLIRASILNMCRLLRAH